MHLMFSVHSTPEEYKKSTITGHSIVFDKLRFRDGLALTVAVTVRIKLRF